MKKSLITLSLLFTSFVFAQKADLIVIDPDMDASSLKDNFNVHYGSTAQNSLPDLDQRDSLLFSVKETHKWDELKKDIFYMDLKSKPLDYLESKYPEIKSSDLKKLKDNR